MIDIRELREFPEQATREIHKKDPEFDVDRLLELDTQVRQLRQLIESLRAEKNHIAQKGKRGQMTQELRERASQLNTQINNQQEELNAVHEQFRALYLHCPNILEASVPEGDESNNIVNAYHGDKPEFTFTPQSHVELAQQLGWIDVKAAREMAGSGFAMYKGFGAQLIYALTSYMLSHNASYGFHYVLPPFMVNYRSLEGSGNFPRFQDDVYHVENDLYLTPTSEVNLTNVYRNTIFESDQVPHRMTAWTSCFRREAGGYGSYERGLIRLHQFEKVELYSITAPDQAHDEHAYMLSCAKDLLDKLGLHYRVVTLAAQDTSFASAQTYDLEVWLPGQNEYREISSVSNCTDFQARRCSIKYREARHEKPQLAHTLNGSSLALPRLFVALLETYQRQDGSVVLPERVRNLLGV